MNETKQTVFEKVPLITGKNIDQRVEEWGSQSRRQYADAKANLQAARAAFEFAKVTLRRTKCDVEVEGFTMKFSLTEIEAMNDLLSAGDMHGRDPVCAVISPDLMQLAAATIQFTRKQRAQFECLGDGMVGVTAKGRGQV